MSSVLPSTPFLPAAAPAAAAPHKPSKRLNLAARRSRALQHRRYAAGKRCSGCAGCKCEHYPDVDLYSWGERMLLQERASSEMLYAAFSAHEIFKQCSSTRDLHLRDEEFDTLRSIIWRSRRILAEIGEKAPADDINLDKATFVANLSNGVAEAAIAAARKLREELSARARSECGFDMPVVVDLLDDDDMGPDFRTLLMSETEEYLLRFEHTAYARRQLRIYGGIYYGTKITPERA
jgi:hypothetical protein